MKIKSVLSNTARVILGASPILNQVPQQVLQGDSVGVKQSNCIRDKPADPLIKMATVPLRFQVCDFLLYVQS
jgi:hypothetical protein